FALDGLELGLAAALVGGLPQILGREAAGHDVVGQHGGELLLHLRLEQAVGGARRQLRERGGGRREHGEGAWPLRALHQARRLPGGDERGVVLRVHRVLDDVLRGIHGSAADVDGLLLHLRARGRRRHGGEDERRDGNRRRQGREFHVHLLHVLFSRRVSGLRMKLRSTGREDAAGGYFSRLPNAVGLQARELAAGDDRPGGLSGGRSAGWLERYRERRVRGEAAGEIGRDGEANRLARLDEPERARLLV